MVLSLNRIGQIAVSVGDIDRSEAFYRDVLGLRRLYRFGDLLFFDCAGVRLLIEKSHDPQAGVPASTIYFACADIVLTVNALAERGVVFTSKPHLIARMEDHDLWMAFFADPDGNVLALMQEAPKGFSPEGA